MEKELKDFDNSTEYFTLNGMEFHAKCVDCYDGDTVKLVFKFKNDFYKWNCRINGIDTPEIKTKNKKEKELAIKARNTVRDLILNKIVKIKCYKFDKYGRLLVDISLSDNNQDLAELLLSQNLANKYNGKTKIPFNF